MRAESHHSSVLTFLTGGDRAMWQGQRLEQAAAAAASIDTSKTSEREWKQPSLSLSLCLAQRPDEPFTQRAHLIILLPSLLVHQIEIFSLFPSHITSSRPKRELDSLPVSYHFITTGASSRAHCLRSHCCIGSAALAISPRWLRSECCRCVAYSLIQ